MTTPYRYEKKYWSSWQEIKPNNLFKQRTLTRRLIPEDNNLGQRKLFIKSDIPKEIDYFDDFAEFVNEYTALHI